MKSNANFERENALLNKNMRDIKVINRDKDDKILELKQINQK